jgi:hypothetical protein
LKSGDRGGVVVRHHEVGSTMTISSTDTLPGFPREDFSATSAHGGFPSADGIRSGVLFLLREARSILWNGRS